MAVGPIPKSWDGERMMKAAMDRYPKAREYKANPCEEKRLGVGTVRYDEDVLPGYVYADIGPDG